MLNITARETRNGNLACAYDNKGFPGKRGLQWFVMMLSFWSQRSPAPAPQSRAQECALRLFGLYCLNEIHRFLIHSKDSLSHY